MAPGGVHSVGNDEAHAQDRTIANGHGGGVAALLRTRQQANSNPEVTMHPEMIRALARERHAELLRQRQFSHIKDHPPPFIVSGTRGVVRGVRRSLGSALVSAGIRLMRTRQTTVDRFETQSCMSDDGCICSC
jgi:hypothetical protein